jgi:hypothetical protein
MASHKTNKRSYKKRPVKKTTQKGGDIQIFGYVCKKEDNKEDKIDVDEDVVENEIVENDNVVEDVDADMNEDVDADMNEVVDADMDEDADEENDEMPGGGKKKPKSKKSTKKGNKNMKKSRKTMKKKKGKSEWTTFVTDLYKKNKKTNPLYMFKNALKDAAKIYKK